MLARRSASSFSVLLTSKLQSLKHLYLVPSSPPAALCVFVPPQSHTQTSPYRGLNLWLDNEGNVPLFPVKINQVMYFKIIIDDSRLWLSRLSRDGWYPDIFLDLRLCPRSYRSCYPLVENLFSRHKAVPSIGWVILSMILIAFAYIHL